MEFCNNQNRYIKIEFEKQIKLTKADFLDIKFNMYAYKREDTVSLAISRRRSWEGKETKN